MHLFLTEAEAQLPTPDGKRFVTLFNYGTLQVELYAPAAATRSSPTPGMRPTSS